MKDDKINWTKCTLLANRIRWVNMFQQTPFMFKEVKVIQKYLDSKMKRVDDEILYQLSIGLEPKK